METAAPYSTRGIRMEGGAERTRHNQSASNETNYGIHGFPPIQSLIFYTFGSHTGICLSKYSSDTLKYASPDRHIPSFRTTNNDVLNSVNFWPHSGKHTQMGARTRCETTRVFPVFSRPTFRNTRTPVRHTLWSGPTPAMPPLTNRTQDLLRVAIMAITWNNEQGLYQGWIVKSWITYLNGTSSIGNIFLGQRAYKYEYDLI